MTRILVTICFLFFSCAEDTPDQSEPFARFTMRPARVQASSALRDECIEALDEQIVPFFRDSGMATLTIAIVDPFSPAVSGVPTLGVIAIYPGVPKRPNSLAETKRAFTIGGWQILSAEIVLRETDARSCDALAIAHELGHALGLVDVENPGNLMNGTFGMGGWSLTESQLRWISD